MRKITKKDMDREASSERVDDQSRMQMTSADGEKSKTVDEQGIE